MTLTANQQGKIIGRFTVPAGVPTGTKLVQFIGDQGSYGDTTYTGRGAITVEERRRVATITETRGAVTTVVLQRYDPLAQTFTLQEGRHICGVDLWFTERGSQKVVVQIRETTVGFPNQTVLAEAHMAASQINLSNAATRITWDPVWLEASREYAIVILTDDADTAVRIAELGKYDALSNRWVTSQAYQVGVLLSSSNASTWTAHQTKDLTFRLLAAKFNSNNREVDLGTIPTEEVSDIIALANVERPAADTQVELLFTDPEGNVTRLSDDQPLALRSRLNGNVQVKAVLKGSERRSPVLYPGIQAVLGNLATTADYITRSIQAGTNSKITVTYESFLPGQSSLAITAQSNPTTWQPIPLTTAMPIGDGWEERTHVLSGFNGDDTRVKLTLSGTPLDRPRVRSLRVVIT